MYHFDVTKAAQSPDLHSIVRLTAQRIQKETYLRLGDWLRDMSTPDVLTLALMVELMEDDPTDPYATTISTLAFLLAHAEGTDITRGNANLLIGSLVMLIAAESLARKGFVEIDYDRVTLDPSSMHEKVIKLTNKYTQHVTGDNSTGDQPNDPTPPT